MIWQCHLQQPVMEIGFWNTVQKVLHWLPQSEHLRWNKTECQSPTHSWKEEKAQPLNQEKNPNQPNPTNQPQNNQKLPPAPLYLQDPKVCLGGKQLHKLCPSISLPWSLAQVSVPEASWLILGKDHPGTEKMAWEAPDPGSHPSINQAMAPKPLPNLLLIWHAHLINGDSLIQQEFL